MIKVKEGYEMVGSKIRKKCAEGTFRDEKTLRCKKVKKTPVKKSPKKSKRSPKKKEGYEMVGSKMRKKCAEGTFRDEKTLRCKKVKKTPVKKSPRKTFSEEDKTLDEIENTFVEMIDELPFITYDEDNDDEKYSSLDLSNDILEIIKDIHKETNIFFNPDTELMSNIANVKFDNEDKKHTKEVNLFLFGNINDGIFDKIKNLKKELYGEYNNVLLPKDFEEKWAKFENVNSPSKMLSNKSKSPLFNNVNANILQPRKKVKN